MSSPFLLQCRRYFELTRLHKFPLGSIVICWPGVLGLAMSAHTFEKSYTELSVQTLIFCLGGTLFHSAFCVYNDICDRDVDGRVARTKKRPLVTGEISLVGAWIAYLSVVSVGLFAMSFAHLNHTAIALGLLSLPLHLLYPLAKRWTWWPQGWLGLSNGWSYFVGWFTFAGRYSSHANIKACLFMYLAMASWTIYFDTIYATQDRKDDADAGIKSTALLFGKNVRGATSAIAALTMFCIVAAGVLNQHGLPYFLISCFGAGAHFAWQMGTWDVNDAKQTGQIFKSNGDWGFLVLAGILADRLFDITWSLTPMVAA